MVPDAESVDDLPLEGLRQVVATLVAEMSGLGGLVEVKDGEIARLKGLPPRPKSRGARQAWSRRRRSHWARRAAGAGAAAR